jgi:hypothetical protein
MEMDHELHPRPFYPWGENIPYTLDRKLGEFQSLFGYCEDENTFFCVFLYLPGFETRFLNRQTYIVTPIAR